MNLRLILAAAGALAAAATFAHAAPVPGTANASASIVSPNQVTSTRDLEFGSVAKPTSGTTTVTVASAATGSATPSLSGGNGFVPSPGQARAATFRITGTSGQGYSVDLGALTFTGAAGNISNAGLETPVSASNSLNTIPADGDDDLHIGGHFDITPATAVQAYSGALSITVNFN